MNGTGVGSQRGVSLVELLLVIAVMGTVAWVGMPLLTSSLGEASLAAVETELTTAIQFAQKTAVSRGRPSRVTIDPLLDTVLVEQAGPDTTGVEDLNDPLLTQLPETTVEAVTYAAVGHPAKRGHQYHVDLTTPRFRGVDVTLSTFGTKNNITFDERGEPSDGGIIWIVLGNTGVLLTVDPVTGRVTSAPLP